MPIIMLLTKEERQKFSMWLIHEADAINTIMEDMKKLPDVPARVIQQYHSEMAACVIVASRLRNQDIKLEEPTSD